MAADIRLCSTCRGIDFESLFFAPGDDPELQNATRSSVVDPEGHSLWLYKGLKETLVGPLASAIKRRGSCDFCAFISEGATVDIDGEPFEIPLQDDGEAITVSLAPEDFGSLRNVCWKGRTVDELFIRKPLVRFSCWEGHVYARLQACVDKVGNSGLPTKGTGCEVPDVVDVGLVKGWIETCRERHGDVCENPSWFGKVEPAPGLRVIDVVGKRIVPAAPGCRYFALSYVWGQTGLPRMAMALRANMGSLGEEGGLARLALPRTIRDAIDLTERLGERYLWVDALCIVQDDMEDLQRQASAMDSVFSGAALTIAAAAGDDADAGLSGLTPGSRRNTCCKIRVTEELSLLASVEQEQQESSTWARRGWTFQEELLSRRILYFTRDLVLWRCDHDTWGEQTILEPEEPVGSFLASVPRLGPYAQTKNRFALEKFDTYAFDYSVRDLSYGSDILPAFQGFMRRYEAVTGERLHWGLPCRIGDIGSALMWRLVQLESGGERQDLRKVLLDDGTVIHMLYPSWSWMGWNSAVDGFLPWHAAAVEIDIRPELDFYKLMSDGRVELLAPCERPTSDDAPRRRILPLTRLWKGSTAIDGPVLTGPDDTGLVREVVPTSPGAAGAHASEGNPVYDTGRLVFWTSHARIRTWSVAGKNGIDPHLQLPGQVLRSSDGQKMGCLSDFCEIDQSTSKRLGDDYRYDFIPDDDPWGDEPEPVSAFLDALVVEWVDEEQGIARKIGKAVFSEADWMAMEPGWKRVILQ
ncbi:heterokaryon incompatibility protein-domain-containing protein [Staphylotrichum tortipilum]|uniref:Heterokaryon incompatibility protein-domain-containing protein n=1 Tax=Staphylotrichum tortipilum TaxID=2831512 RepID=A0AAN6ML84_9PEZI|nr:heterokaryon incompatibility protein-domain-containing protein [Staphylotrichum longicolle]